MDQIPYSEGLRHCCSKPDRGSSFLRLAFHGYQLSDLFSKDYIAPIAILAIGDVPRVRRTQFESINQIRDREMA
jgi:hypothetical protein